MDRLNIFNPYRDKDVTHEDALTRNFLILLKNIPVVQIAFFELIREKSIDVDLESIALGKLTVSEVHTQVSSGGILKLKQGYNILSVYISDDTFATNHDVKESERKARYDGVIICEPSWIFIIENKPYVSNAWEDQLDPNKEDAEGNTIIKASCRLSWREIIDILSSVMEYNVETILEKTLIDDFQSYVNENFPRLNPYNKLGLCNENKWLLDKRCAEILKECFEDKTIEYHKGWKYYIDTSDEDEIVRQVALDSDTNVITLWMNGGDTMNSARSMYCKIDCEKIDELMKKTGYLVSPNFHISYRNTGLVWYNTEISVVEYVRYWQDIQKTSGITQVDKEKLEEYCNELSKKSIIVSDTDYLQNKILSKQYPKLNVCPGLFFGYRWKLEDAIRLDKAGSFVSECKERIKAIRNVYGK